MLHDKGLVFIRLVAVLAVAFALSTWIDPHLDVTSSLAAQAVNAVVPLVLVLLVWGLSGRAWFALVVEAVALGLLGYADHLKLENLDTDLVYADFTVLGSLLRNPRLVLGFVPAAPRVVAIGLGVVAAVGAGFWFSRRLPRASRRFRLGCVAAVVAAAMGISYGQAPNVIAPLQWEVFGQASGARTVGVAGNVMLGRMTTRAVNRKADPVVARAFWNEPAIRKARSQLAPSVDGQVRPDIVVIQSESLFEPSQLRGFADRPVLEHVDRAPDASGGQLHVPVFGGRTLQTEYEMLTGVPVAFYPGSMFAYYDLVHHRIDALPRVLGDLGYHTLVMHPNDRGFWRRGVVMPQMGFDTFQDIGSYIYPRDFSEREHVSDAALTRSILAELDAATGPTFITAITMDNHGPWGDFAPRDDSTLRLPAAVSGEARTKLADYVARAIDADKAYGFLLDALKRRQRPTIVLIYGDHLPALPKVYKQLGFKDGKPAEQHFPPYRVWANFAIPPALGNTTSYLLQGWLLRAAGLPLRGHGLANALAGMAASDPETGDAERRRILDEYAHVAAQFMSATASRQGRADKFFVGKVRALDLLLASAVQRLPAADVSENAHDLRLNPGRDGSTTLSFALDSRVATLTLRPYVGVATAQCLGGKALDRGQFRVDADGQTLYRASLNPQIMRLDTLDLRGVRRLTLTVTGDVEAGACRDVYIRVAQMQCYSADCDVPRPGPAAAAATRPLSRILAADPARGDIPASAALVSTERAHTLARVANLRWLLGHETSRHQGYSPITVADDAQLFMHPAEDHAASIAFNVTGIDSVVLTPRINPLSDECKAMNEPGKEGGVVGLTVSLDGTPVEPRFLVDRSYGKPLPIVVGGGHALRIEVDKGNSVTWCDWFSVGVDKLAGPAVSAGGGASMLPTTP